MAIEEHVKGLVTNKILNTDGYPKVQDKTSKDGITWYKEDSYQKFNPKISALLSTATKSITGKNPGTPDFIVDSPEFYIVIETKGIEKHNNHKHSRFTDVREYLQPNATRNDQVYDTKSIKNRECAIDEALFYASFLNEDKHVIAIAASGSEKDLDFRFTSFLLPKGENLSKLFLLEDGGLNNTFNTIENYKREIYRSLGYEEKLYRAIYEDLRKYADMAAKFLNTNGVDENDRLGLVSAIVLALTNKNSDLYKKVSSASKLDISPEEIKNALLSEKKPFGVIIEDNLPAEKRNTLKAYFEALLNKPFLVRTIKTKDGNEINTKNFFEINKGFADTILSRLTYSLYNYNGKEELTTHEKIEICGPDVGMINPPYEEDVFEFINSMLLYLRKDGIGIAIVPINTQSTNSEVTGKKNKLLENNTLLASILMPPTLFNGVRGSGAATSTCILVFRAHRPHKDFVNQGGLTYLADWSTDGFKLIPKHGRFEQNDMWNDPENGYKKLYLADLKTVCGEKEYILSSNYKIDIHIDGSIKSIRKPIHKFTGIKEVIKHDKNGNVVYKKDRVVKKNENGDIKYNRKGKPLYCYIDAVDENGQLIPETEKQEVFINEDWNILDYVKTDYSELGTEHFIKSLLDYNLFLYMNENSDIFENQED